MIFRLAPTSPTTSPPQERGGRRRLALAALAALLAPVLALSALRAGQPAGAATTYTVTRALAAGSTPTDVALDPTAGRQFVMNADTGVPGISVVSDATGAVVTNYPTIQLPVGLAFDAPNNLLYTVQRSVAGPVLATFGTITVAQVESYALRIQVFNASTGEIANAFQTNGYVPAAMVKEPSRNQVLVAMTRDTAAPGPPGVIRVDLDIYEILQSYPTPGPATGVAVNPSNGFVYITALNSLSSSSLPLAGTLTVFQPNGTQVAQLPVGVDPGDVALDLTGRRAYVVNRGAGGSVSVVNLDTNQVLRTVPVAGAQQVAVDPGTDVYVTRFEENVVSVLRPDDLAVQATVAVNGAPDGVAVDPAAHRAYVTTSSDGRLVTITRQVTTDPTTPQTTAARPPTTLAPPPTTIAVPRPTTATTRAPATTTTTRVAPVPSTVALTTTTVTAVAPPSGAGGPGRPTTTIARSQQAAAQFIDALPSPLETRTSLADLAGDAFLAILFLALLSLPINVVNGIAETHNELLAARAAGIGQRFRPSGGASLIANLPLGLVLVVAAVVSAVLYGFLQPSFGLDEASLALVLGVTLAVLILNSVQRLSQIAYLRRAFSAGAFLRLLPGFAVVAVGCVAVSRLVGLQPGLLLGPLATVGLRDQLDAQDQGKALAVSYTSVAVLGLVAWFTRSSVVGLFDPGTLVGEVVGVAWTTLVIACTETVAFNMIPLRFLDGYQVFKWSKAAWAGLAVFGVYGFVHVLVNPSSGAGDFSDRTGYLAILLVVYLILAAAFWAYFRFKTAHMDASPIAPVAVQAPSPPPTPFPPPPPLAQAGEDSMQATWRAMQGSGWPGPRT